MAPLRHLPDLTHTRPVCVAYRAKTIAAKEMTTWKKVYVAIVSRIYRDNPQIPKGVPLYPKGRCPEIVPARCRDILRNPAYIASKWCVETNHSANTIINNIKRLLELAAIPYTAVSIGYEHRSDASQDQTDDVEVSVDTEPSDAAEAVTLDEFRFYGYLLIEEKLPEDLAHSYAEAIFRVEIFCEESGYRNWRLYNVDATAINAVLKRLLTEDDFMLYNEHNASAVSLLTAIKLLLKAHGAQQLIATKGNN